MFNKNINLRLTHFENAQKIFVRKEQNLKYAKFVLPSDINDIHGFQMSFYCKFTALSKTLRETTMTYVINMTKLPE